VSFGRSVGPNHCGVMAAWSRNTGRFVKEYLRFVIKRPHMVIFLKFCSEIFHCDTDRCRCVQISWNVANGKSAKSCAIYQTTNFACLSNCSYCGNRAQNLPGPTPNNVLRVMQISSKSVHFQRSYSQIALYGKSKIQPKPIASSRIIITKQW